jgi:rhamnose utilization protein RhaD (predicted bifunctional aldolase and dehydrogenase)
MLDYLVEMTCALGQPPMEYVVVGEGNTSFRENDEVFWIKSSGQGMHGITNDGFVAVRFAPILDLLDHPLSDSAQMQSAIMAAKFDQTTPQRPSVEVTFHAMLLSECGVNYIGHTHPIAVNRLLCSTRAEQFAFNRLFPDEVVLCGPRSVFVPYLDPGLPLAHGIRQQVREYMDEFGEAPKVILLANHGLIVLGQSPAEILNVTAMCVKAAHIFAGACTVGEPVFMSQADIAHIYKRPDEIFRRARFVQK